MTRGWKIAIAVVVAVVAADLMLVGLRDLTGGSPGGPAASSYATGADGAAAYASLLGRAGHPVHRSRLTPSTEALGPGDTAVILDPPFVLDEDTTALHAFVAGGGRLVAAPAGSAWLRKLVGARGNRAGTTPLGSGAVVVLPVSVVQNATLAQGDNALRALRAAGPSGRRVVFFESYHGYGKGSGLGALPSNWQAALLTGVLAVLVLVAARIRRFGPPEPEARELEPPRAQYVEALAATLQRSRDPAALDPVRAEVVRRIAVRSGLRADAGDRALAEAAARLGLPADEVSAIGGARDELALGRALARTGDRRLTRG